MPVILKLVLMLVVLQVIMRRREGFKVPRKGIEYKCRADETKSGVDCSIKVGDRPTTRFTCDTMVGPGIDGWDCRSDSGEYRIPKVLIQMAMPFKKTV